MAHNVFNINKKQRITLGTLGTIIFSNDDNIIGTMKECAEEKLYYNRYHLRLAPIQYIDRLNLSFDRKLNNKGFNEFANLSELLFSKQGLFTPIDKSYNVSNIKRHIAMYHFLDINNFRFLLYNRLQLMDTLVLDLRKEDELNSDILNCLVNLSFTSVFFIIILNKEQQLWQNVIDELIVKYLQNEITSKNLPNNLPNNLEYYSKIYYTMSYYIESGKIINL